MPWDQGVFSQDTFYFITYLRMPVGFFYFKIIEFLTFPIREVSPITDSIIIKKQTKKKTQAVSECLWKLHDQSIYYIS